MSDQIMTPLPLPAASDEPGRFIIEPAIETDLAVIYALFEEAIAFQKEHGFIGWASYDKAFIRSDISKGLLFKVMRGAEVICIFSICFADILIWRDKEQGDAVYLHRIILNRKFAGLKIFRKVLEWSVDFARQAGLAHIRMDTWAGNAKIIGYYQSYGFRFIENYTTSDSEELPLQHRSLAVALLQFSL